MVRPKPRAAESCLSPVPRRWNALHHRRLQPMLGAASCVHATHVACSGPSDLRWCGACGGAAVWWPRQRTKMQIAKIVVRRVNLKKTSKPQLKVSLNALKNHNWNSWWKLLRAEEATIPIVCCSHRGRYGWAVGQLTPTCYVVNCFDGPTSNMSENLKSYILIVNLAVPVAMKRTQDMCAATHTISVVCVDQVGPRKLFSTC